MTGRRGAGMMRLTMAAVARDVPCGAPGVGGEFNARMARGAVRVHRGTVGRGPNRARAFFHDDVFVVPLSEVMTRAEHTLMARGRRDAVVIGRETLLEAMRSDLIGTAEAVTGCQLRARPRSRISRLMTYHQKKK
jgi:uncharacterized protein YbcI